MKKPRSYAGALAIGYLVVCSAYIVISGQVAAHAAVSVDDLQHTELIKGLLFVGTTSALIFVLALVLFRRLARAVEDAARHRAALVAAERRATAGLFAASIAHDFNNLLTILNSGVQMLEKDVPPESRELFADVLAAIARGTDLAHRLSHAGKGSAVGVLETVELDAVVGEAIDFVHAHRAARDASIELVTEGALRFDVYPALVHQLVTNLVLNALEAAGRGARVRVEVRGDGDGVLIAVHDNGPGVPAALRDRLFDPFFTTKDDGTGLGLLSAKACAELHGGHISIESSSLGGACFRAHWRVSTRPPEVSVPAVPGPALGT